LKHIFTAMAVAHRPQPLPSADERAAIRADALTIGIALLAVYSLGLALVMAAAPHAFFTGIGPFGPRNDHYIRDTATFSAAIGVGLAISLGRRSWRVPMLAIATVQLALHSVNHLVDIDAAHPAWKGYFDFAGLAASTFLVAGLLWLALADAGASAGEQPISTGGHK
jgi:hypothetical protein